MLHAFLTFFTQPTGEMLSQLFGTIFFGLFVIGAAFALFDYSKNNPNMAATIAGVVIFFAVISSSEGAKDGAIFTGALGIYAIGALLTAIAAAMATPVFWLIIIAMLIANKD